MERSLTAIPVQTENREAEFSPVWYKNYLLLTENISTAVNFQIWFTGSIIIIYKFKAERW